LFMGMFKVWQGNSDGKRATSWGTKGWTSLDLKESRELYCKLLNGRHEWKFVASGKVKGKKYSLFVCRNCKAVHKIPDNNRNLTGIQKIWRKLYSLGGVS